MRRVDLERRLRELGWQATNVSSGTNHTRWVHPNHEFFIAVPNYD
jgi:hypothetical protein